MEIRSGNKILASSNYVKGKDNSGELSVDMKAKLDSPTKVNMKSTLGINNLKMK